MGRRVRVEVDGLALPDGGTYDTGDEVDLTDEQFAQIAATALGDEVTDLGSVQGDVTVVGDPDATAAAAAPATKTVVVEIEGTQYRLALYAV